MRINQSPHWRALALLGALLSVIIVWPTVLSMPMLTTRTPTTTTSPSTTNITNTEAEQHPSLITSYSLNLTSNNNTINSIAAPNNSSIQINHKQITDFSEYSDYGSYLFHLNVNTSNDSNENEDQYDDEDNNRDIDVEEHLTHDRADIDPLYAIMTDGNVSNSRRVKKSNMVYNKRKRKKNVNNSNKDSSSSSSSDNNDDEKVSANEDVSNATYLSSASISDYDSSTTVSNSLSKINNNNYNNDNINSVSVSDVLNSDEVTAASSIISHHYQSKRTRNFNKSDYDDNGDVASTTLRYNYTPTTLTSTDDFDETSNFSNLDQQTPTMTTTSATKLNDNFDTYVTSTPTSTSTTSSSTAIESRTKTLTHTELPVLSRTDRSVHTKHGSVSLRHRSNASRNNGNGRAIDAAEEGVSIKPRRLNNHNKIHNFRNNNTTNSNSSNLDRNERSTILEDISGPGRKIQLYIKNRFIQLMTDGTVNGTMNDLSEYTILQRTTVDVGRIKIQSVATCLYLCMDQCGAVYGSKEFTDDCVFNESMEQHNYNTYSSTYNSNSRRIYYLALNRHGEPRKLQIPPSRPLGKLATYTKAITGTVPQDRVETVIAKIFGKNRVKHGIRQLCDTGKPIVELTDKILKARPQCPATSSNSNSNSNNNNNSNSNKNGQLNVPAANDKSSNSSLTNSSSNSNSSSSGHTSGNSNNNHVIKKKKKKRRCRPGENEDEHNCQRGGGGGGGGGPQAMKKRPNNNNNNNKNNRLAKCKESAPDAAAALECANQKRPKKGGKKQQNGGPKHKQNGGQGPQGRRGGKKLNQNGRQQQGGSNSSKKNNGKQPKNGLSGGERTTQSSTTTTTTTTIHPIINDKMVRTPRSRPAPLTLKPTASTTPTPTTTTTTTTTTTAATTLATLLQVANQNQQSFASHNQLSSSQIAAVNQTSSESQDADNNSEGDDTTAEEEAGTGEAEEDDLAAADDDDTSSHLPFIGEHTQLVGGADDFLYDDDLDL